MSDFKTYLAQALNDELPGWEAQQRMVPTERRVEQPEPQPDYRKSAVFALFYPEDNGTHLLFIRRPVYNGHHSGQIAFPGGKQEPNDRDMVDTALRETEEEVGIHRDKIEILGSLSQVQIPVSKFTVQPYVGWIDHKPALSIQEEEVDEVLTFHIHHLLNIENEVRRRILVGENWRINVPCFEFEGHIVWGATALMTAELTTILRLSKDVVKYI